MTLPIKHYMTLPISPFIDLEQDIKINMQGKLPHWHQDYTIQYVTFRLGDSLPVSKIADLMILKESFEKSNPKPWDKETKIRYQNIIGPLEDKLLDNGYGSCILKFADIRKYLTDTIFFRNHEDYEVLSFVIMPNHVHMLLFIASNTDLNTIMKSIKGFSSRCINKHLSRTGTLWMKESFDREVRSYEHFKRYLSYIRNNPKYMKEGTFELYEDAEAINKIIYGINPQSISSSCRQATSLASHSPRLQRSASVIRRISWNCRATSSSATVNWPRRSRSVPCCR